MVEPGINTQQTCYCSRSRTYRTKVTWQVQLWSADQCCQPVPGTNGARLEVTHATPRRRLSVVFHDNDCVGVGEAFAAVPHRKLIYKVRLQPTGEATSDILPYDPVNLVLPSTTARLNGRWWRLRPSKRTRGNA